jgi:hypothetical protein
MQIIIAQKLEFIDYFPPANHPTKTGNNIVIYKAISINVQNSSLTRETQYEEQNNEKLVENLGTHYMLINKKIIPSL